MNSSATGPTAPPAANATLNGACPAPFLDSTKFPRSGGYIAGRMCAPLGPGAECCLPCPATDFIYPKSFRRLYRAAEGLNAAGLVLLLFILVSFIFLPADKTRRHYLSVCLIIAIIVEALGFVVPLLVRPAECYNAITPNDMYSSMTCAWSGALLISGGFSIVVWIFARALSMHLQICWDVMPGQRFFYSAQAIGWSVVATFFTLTIVLTGFSFRFGDTCHVNSKDSIKVFWAPLLTVAGLTSLVQFTTFAYCINVYLKNIWSDLPSDTRTTTTLPSFTTSINTHSAKAVYRRVSKVIWLQWRSMLLVVFILIDVIYFACVFIYMDNLVVDIVKNGHLDRILPFMVCLYEAGGPSEKCFPLGQKAFVSMPTVASILILMGIAGLQCFSLMVRRSMFTGWATLFKNMFSRKREFVSANAKELSAVHRSYELLKVGSQEALNQQTLAKSADSVTLASVTDTQMSFVSYKTDFLSKEFKEVTRPASSSRPASRRSQTGSMGSMEHSNWSSPTMSFAGPRTPSQIFRSESVGSRHAREWDFKSSFARGGLAMHPPTEEDEREIAENRDKT